MVTSLNGPNPCRRGRATPKWMPPWDEAGRSSTATLKDEAANAVGSRSRRPRNVLVVLQMALSMALLVGFGLLFRSLLHVESSSLGYDPNNVLTATLRLPPSLYADPPARARLIRERTGEVVVFEIGGVGQIHGGARRLLAPSIAENAPGGALAPALPVARPPLGS